MTAKSRRDEKTVFEFPEFDKEEYISKEFRDAKLTGLVLFYAVAVAIISYLLARVDSAYIKLSLLLIVLAELGLKEFFTFFKIKVSEFEKKNWIGSILLLFFAWFGIFTLLLNPPFMDIVDPHVKAIDLYTMSIDSEGNITYLRDNEPTINTTITINATVVDNCQVNTVILTIILPDNSTHIYSMERTESENEYSWGNLTLSLRGTYIFRVHAEDEAGNTGEREMRILVE